MKNEEIPGLDFSAFNLIFWPVYDPSKMSNRHNG